MKNLYEEYLEKINTTKSHIVRVKFLCNIVQLIPKIKNINLVPNPISCSDTTKAKLIRRLK